MCILRLEAGEEQLLLAGGGDARDKFGAVTGYEFVRRSHVEDKLAADQFGGGVIKVGASYWLLAVSHWPLAFMEAQGGEDEGDALDLYGHADNGRVEIAAEDTDECVVLGREMCGQTLLLFGRERPLLFRLGIECSTELGELFADLTADGFGVTIGFDESRGEWLSRAAPRCEARRRNNPKLAYTL